MQSSYTLGALIVNDRSAGRYEDLNGVHTIVAVTQPVNVEIHVTIKQRMVE